MITFVWLNGSGNPMAIGKAASILSLPVKELRNALIKWENTQYQEGFTAQVYSCSLTFTGPDQFSICSILKTNRQGRQLRRVKFSMELTL